MTDVAYTCCTFLHKLLYGKPVHIDDADKEFRRQESISEWRKYTSEGTLLRCVISLLLKQIDPQHSSGNAHKTIADKD